MPSERAKLASGNAPRVLPEIKEPHEIYYRRHEASLHPGQLPSVDKREVTLDERLERIRNTLDKSSQR